MVDKNNPDIIKMVGEIVQDILAGKASASASTKLEEMLSEASATIESLKEKVVDLEKAAVDNTTVVEDLEKAKTVLETEKSALTGQVDSLTEEKSTLEERATAAEDTIANMAKDKAADSRMSELAELKLVRVDEKAAASQKEAVREMSDEDFASYRDERVALRDEILAAVDPEPASDGEPAVDANGVPEVVVPEAASGKGADGNVVTPPADIEGALENASAALPNLPSINTGKVWDGFGDCMTNLVEKGRGDSPETNK